MLRSYCKLLVFFSTVLDSSRLKMRERKIFVFVRSGTNLDGLIHNPQRHSGEVFLCGITWKVL